MLRSVLLLVAALLVAMPARADPPRPDPPHAAVHLVYHQSPGPNACSDETGFRLAVRKELGYDPFVDGAPQRLTVNLGWNGAEFTGDAELQNERGIVVWTRKDLTGRACASLIRALSFAIAIRLEKRPGPAPCPVCPPAPVCPAAEEHPVPQAPAVASTPALAAEEVRSRPIFLVGAAPLFAVRSPAAVAPGVSFFGSVRWPSVSLTVEARAVFPGTGDEQPTDIRPLSLTGVIVPCGHFRWLFGCGVLSLGGLHITGPDVPPQRRALVSASAGVRVGIEQPIGERLYFRGYIDALGTLNPRVLVRHPRDWIVPNVAGVAGLGLALRL